MFQFYVELIGKNFLLYLLKPLIEEVRKAKMNFTLDGKDFGVDFYKKNLKKYMTAVDIWIQTLPNALNCAPVYSLTYALSPSVYLLSLLFLFTFLITFLFCFRTLWRVCKELSKLSPNPLLGLFFIRWICVALDTPERYTFIFLSPLVSLLHSFHIHKQLRLNVELSEWYCLCG
jgi:hypothetical protein